MTTHIDPATLRSLAADQRLARAAGRFSQSLAKLRAAVGPEHSALVDEVTVCLLNYLNTKVSIAREEAAAAHQRPAGWKK